MPDGMNGFRETVHWLLSSLDCTWKVLQSDCSARVEENVSDKGVGGARFSATIFQDEIVPLFCRDTAVHYGSASGERCNLRLLDRGEATVEPRASLRRAKRAAIRTASLSSFCDVSLQSGRGTLACAEESRSGRPLCQRPCFLEATAVISMTWNMAKRCCGAGVIERCLELRSIFYQQHRDSTNVTTNEQCF